MNTNLYKYFLKITFCFLFSLLFINVSLAWWNENWRSRILVNITNKENDFVFNMSVSIPVDTQSLISQGKMKSDCSDVRVLLDDSILVNSVGVKDCNSASSQIVFKYNFSALETKTFYIYFNNPNASNILIDWKKAYYALYEDFESGSTNLFDDYQYITNGGWVISYDSTYGYVLKRRYSGDCGDTFCKSSYVSKIKVASRNARITFDKYVVGNCGDFSGFGFTSDNGNYNYEIKGYTSHIDMNNGASNFIRFVNITSGWSGIISNVINQQGYNSYTYVRNKTHSFGCLGSSCSNIYYHPNFENFPTELYVLLWHAQTSYCAGFVDNVKVENIGILGYSYTLGNYEYLNDFSLSIITFNPENKTYYKRNYLDKVRFILVSDDNTTIPYDIIVNNGGFEGGTAYNNTVKESYANLTFGSGAGYLHEGNNVIEIYAYNKYGLTPYTCSLGIDCNKTSIIFNVKNYDFINASSETYIYETETYNYSISVRINPDIVTNTNAILWWNGTYNQYTNRIIYNKENYTDIVFTTTLTIPLIQSNNTIVNKFYEIDYFLSNSTVKDEFYDINVNNILYAFYLEPTTNNQIQNATNVIEGDKFINRVYVVNKSSNKNVNIDVKSYYNNVEYQSYYSSKYNQYNSYDSLITANMVNNDYETHNLYSNITITYNGSKRTHTTETDNINVYMIKLKNCDVNDLITLNYTLRNEKYNTPINATLEQSFSVYNGVITRNYSFSTTDYYKEICIYPKWAKYRIDNINYYYNTVYKPRFYNIKNTEISNSTQTIILYLSEYAEEVLVYVKDNNNNPLSNVIVKALKYYPSLNEYKTITQSMTDDDGKAMLYLDVGLIYYKFIIESDGVVLKTTNPMTITCSAGYSCPPYYINIYVEDKQQSNFDYIKDIAYHCRLNTTSSNLICSVIDTRLFSTDSRLVVYKKGAFDFNKICDITGDTAGSEIICNLGNLTDNIFKYNLYVKLNNEYLLLENEIIDLKDKPINFGIDGLLLSFIIILTLSFVGIWNAQVSIFLSILGIIAGYTIGFVTISISSLISLILVAIILIIRGNR